MNRAVKSSAVHAIAAVWVAAVFVTASVNMIAPYVLAHPAPAQPAPGELELQGSYFAATLSQSSPLVLAHQGNFFVGGTIQWRDPKSSPQTDPRFPAGEIAVNQMYVEYQIPVDQRYRYPVILVHGGGHSGMIWQTTPDGREGWYTSLARRGFSSFVVDAPNRGRSGYDPTQIYRVREGLDDPSTLPEGNTYARHGAWEAFRIGPAYPTQYPDQQSPVEFFDEYVRQFVPAYRAADQNERIVDGLVALIDKLGPCILVGWSTGVLNSLDAAAQRPTLVKGVVGIESAAIVGFEHPERLAAVPVAML
jgi:pimeloyl-ACP methyl ester carboxylesterase